MKLFGKYLFFSIYFIYDICLLLSTFACYITYALSEQQKINIFSFLYKAERKPKKAKKDIAGIRHKQQTKQHEINVSKQNILAAHSSDESAFTDESLPS